MGDQAPPLSPLATTQDLWDATVTEGWEALDGLTAEKAWHHCMLETENKKDDDDQAPPLSPETEGWEALNGCRQRRLGIIACWKQKTRSLKSRGLMLTNSMRLQTLSRKCKLCLLNV